MAAQRGDDRREVQQLSDSQSCRTKVRADHYEALVGLNIRQKPGKLSSVADVAWLIGEVDTGKRDYRHRRPRHWP